MPPRHRPLLWLLFALLSVPSSAAERTWRFAVDNDIVFGSDDQYSSGWSLQVHGDTAERLEETGGTPAFGRTLARWALPTPRPDRHFREGWAIGQNLQTPSDLEASEPLHDDVPYAASLGVLQSWIAFDDRSFCGVGWLFGVVGPAAGGRLLQRPVHELIGSPDPKGWRNQIDNEPLINVYYERKHKLWRRPRFDLAAAWGAQLGNAVTGADLGFELRLGRQRPRGFVVTPAPVGRRLSFHGELPPEDSRHSFHASLAVRIATVGRLLFLDAADDAYRVERENPVGEVVLGLHYSRGKWGIHGNLWLTTDVVDPAIAPPGTDTTNNVGNLMFEYRPGDGGRPLNREEN